MNGGDGDGGAGAARARRAINARRRIGATCALLAVCAAGWAQNAPHTKPDPARETQSAVADYNAGDYRAALVQFHDAAERGDRLAQFNYAMMLLTGVGVTANVDEGLRWLKRAADANMSHAQYVYGRMFDDGEFVARNPAEAHRWFLRAAKQGHVQAELSLANQFLDGRGTPRDNRQAFVWYKQAADAGEPTAQYVTASFYERGGDGVTQNLNIARAYYAAAAAHGDEAAGLKFKELSARLKAQEPASGAGADHGSPRATPQ
ncbi:tetratricopeptide repeat protein [Burkholderia latens]|uniref:tetratricopeptide repeat protein n=1 Tax=Burkholderia latens TaxID=488446 RepID=UPI001589B116|nr:tetratricopeptide repeat protein [Burkholderia latens]